MVCWLFCDSSMNNIWIIPESSFNYLWITPTPTPTPTSPPTPTPNNIQTLIPSGCWRMLKSFCLLRENIWNIWDFQKNRISIWVRKKIIAQFVVRNELMTVQSNPTCGRGLEGGHIPRGICENTPHINPFFAQNPTFSPIFLENMKKLPTFCPHTKKNVQNPTSNGAKIAPHMPTPPRGITLNEMGPKFIKTVQKSLKTYLFNSSWANS